MRHGFLLLALSGCVTTGAHGYFWFPGTRHAPVPVLHYEEQRAAVSPPPLVAAECPAPAQQMISTPVDRAEARASVGAEAACAEPANAALPVCTEFFGVPLAGSTDIVFLLDRSQSMAEAANFGDQSQQPGAAARVDGVAIGVPSYASGPLLPDKLTVAKLELLKVLGHLPDGTRFAIGFFDDDLTWFAPQLTVLDAETRAQAHRFADSIHARGATAAVPALEASFVLGPKRVVLLSDGLPNYEGGAGDLLALARAQIKSGVRFDTVSIGFEENSALLASLAKESGGTSQAW